MFFSRNMCTYDKIPYVKIRTYDSINTIRMIRMVELWMKVTRGINQKDRFIEVDLAYLNAPTSYMYLYNIVKPNALHLVYTCTIVVYT